MTTTSVVVPAEQWTAADVHARVGGIPLERIRTFPAPGTATEADVLETEARSDRICELVDGILVEKPPGSYESLLAGKIIHALCSYLESNNVGVVLGEAGMLAFLPRQVRVPDVSLIRWERLPGRQLPQERIYTLFPDLAVEVLSPGNTEAEMRRKLHEYFSAGSRLVWYIAPETRTARAYTAEDQWQDLGSGDSLSGGDVLPGFLMSLNKLFDM